MILVDTSVWIEHLRRGDKNLQDHLEEERVCIHPFVIGELACGNLANRSEILRLLSALPRSKPADHNEVLLLLDKHRLHGKGLGCVDAHLLASALLTGCDLWTRDETLRSAARRLGVAV